MKNIVKRLRMQWLLTFRHRLVDCGPDTYIGDRVRIRPNSVRLGRSCFIGPECWLASQADVGDFVMLAGRVAFVGGDHRMDRPDLPMIEAGRAKNQPIRIGNDVWIGYGAVILHGVTIGDGAVVGAGAVVTRNVEPGAIAVGSPAKTIRQRFDPAGIEIHRRMVAKRCRTLQANESD